MVLTKQAIAILKIRWGWILMGLFTSQTDNDRQISFDPLKAWDSLTLNDVKPQNLIHFETARPQPLNKLWRVFNFVALYVSENVYK